MEPLKLNVGCGRNVLAGWTHVDSAKLPGVDVVADLEAMSAHPLPFADDSVDEFLLSHVLEHIRHALPLMQELHRIARPGAVMTIRAPHGASDDASEDPTHVRLMFPNSFAYFSQLAYWRADYGYRGDWEMRKLTLSVNPSAHQGRSQAEVLHSLSTDRNVVGEMVAELVAVKPLRLAGGPFVSTHETIINLL
jgi:ubiquinone/menaquinone biosynthesis C-methylase UbiE